MEKTRRLVLDRQHLVDMLGDPSFFESCPEFLWLRQTALQTKAIYDENSKTVCCGRAWPIMQPVVDAFFKNLKELKELGQKNVQSVRDYLETKKGVQYGKIVIYYRATRSQPHPQRFTF
jgi:hypothetical protein